MGDFLTGSEGQKMMLFRPVVRRTSAGLLGGSFRQAAPVLSRPLMYDHATVVSAMGRKKGKGGKVEAEEASEDVDVRADAITNLEGKIAFSLDRLQKDLGNINAGRAAPELLSKVQVDAYGAKEPLTKLAQVAVKDHQTLMVNVFDPSLTKAVATAIQEAQLQLNPQVVGSAVRVPVPRVTKEYRQQLAKQVAAVAEEAKIAARKHRHDVLGLARKHKDSLGKDVLFRLEEELTRMTNAAVKRITEEADKKTKDVTRE